MHGSVPARKGVPPPSHECQRIETARRMMPMAHSPPTPQALYRAPRRCPRTSQSDLGEVRGFGRRSKTEAWRSFSQPLEWFAVLAIDMSESGLEILIADNISDRGNNKPLPICGDIQWRVGIHLNEIKNRAVQH